MKRNQKITALFSTLLLLVLGLSNCATKTQSGAAIGAAAGAVVGAVVGHQSGDRDEGAAIGAALGAGIGALTGRRLDRQQAELERIAQTRRTDQGLIVTLAENKVYFASNSTVVSSSSRQTLLELGAVLKRYPENMILVAGHTDSVGAADYNLNLSRLRAEAVGDILIASGVPRPALTHRGYGETQPIASNQTKQGRDQNRRVELTITIDESKVPRR